MALKHFFTSNKKRTFLLIGIIIMSLGIISTVIFTYFADPNNPYTVTETTLLTQDDVTLRATVFIPENKTGCGIGHSDSFFHIYCDPDDHQLSGYQDCTHEPC